MPWLLRLARFLDLHVGRVWKIPSESRCQPSDCCDSLASHVAFRFILSTGLCCFASGPGAVIRGGSGKPSPSTRVQAARLASQSVDVIGSRSAERRSQGKEKVMTRAPQR